MIYILHAALIVSVSAIIAAWLFRRCRHDWVVLKQVRLWDTTISRSMPIGTKYVMQCKKCGAIKKKEV